MLKLNARELRQLANDQGEQLTYPKNDIYIIVDNVLDTYNIGSIFRLADAGSVKKIYLCGSSETPPNHRIKKASINPTEIVDWEYCETAKMAIEKLKSEVKNLTILAIEQTDRSVPYNKFEYKLPLALIVGHETTGISKETLSLCDACVELPMLGVNISLNVMVSLGIVLYKVISETITD